MRGITPTLPHSGTDNYTDNLHCTPMERPRMLKHLIATSIIAFSPAAPPTTPPAAPPTSPPSASPPKRSSQHARRHRRATLPSNPSPASPPTSPSSASRPRLPLAHRRGFGGGAYSVVLTRDVEPADAVERFRNSPTSAASPRIGRLLLPTRFHPTRSSATPPPSSSATCSSSTRSTPAFHDRDLARPISVVTLGLSPTKATNVTTTASAVLMDTRNGFVYGVAEAQRSKSGVASAWTSEDAIDGDRKRTETEAFEKLVGEIETMWQGVSQTFAHSKTVPAGSFGG